MTTTPARKTFKGIMTNNSNSVAGSDLTDRIKALLADCVAEALEQGWDGDVAYEYTAEDLEWVTDQLGRKPTLAEWRAATSPGYWIGGAHCAAEAPDRWWKFGGSNLQPIYGYGTEAEADRYADYLNRDRDINCYQVDSVDDPDALARLDEGNEGFAISEELDAIKGDE